MGVRIKVVKYQTPKFNQLCTVVGYADEDGYVNVRLWDDNRVWSVLCSELEYLHSIDEVVPTVRSQMRRNLRHRVHKDRMYSIAYAGTLVRSHSQRLGYIEQQQMKRRMAREKSFNTIQEAYRLALERGNQLRVRYNSSKCKKVFQGIVDATHADGSHTISVKWSSGVISKVLSVNLTVLCEVEKRGRFKMIHSAEQLLSDSEASRSTAQVQHSP